MELSNPPNFSDRSSTEIEVLLNAFIALLSVTLSKSSNPLCIFTNSLDTFVNESSSSVVLSIVLLNNHCEIWYNVIYFRLC